MKPRLQLTAAILLICTLSASAAVRYVDLNCANATPPFTNWATAATNIQDAVDASTSGDVILATNGVYQTGGRLTGDGTTNRVAVTKSVTLQGVYGSAATVIDGGHSLRCIYLTNGASLIGFTLTNGSAGNGAGAMCATTNVLLSNCLLVNNTASSGGGVYSGILTNCTLSGNSCPVTGASGGGALGSTLVNCTLSGNVTGRPYPNTTGGTAGGGASGCILSNCTLNGNSAYGAGGSGGGASSSTLNNCMLSNNYADGDGGGAYWCNLNNCTLSNNKASSGGGVTEGTLNHCLLSGNRAGGSGGGADYNVTLNDCTLTGNFAGWGAGASGCTLNNCVLSNNNGSYGVGAYYSTLNNCLLVGNSGYQGVGAYLGSLNNCTIVSNSASYEAGGEYGAVLQNCIIYYNTDGANFYPNYQPVYNYGGSLNYCCTTPLPSGTDNITNAPIFINQAGGDFHLQSNSPCINAGDNAYVSVTNDLDGNPRIVSGTVDIGAYESQSPVSVISYAWLQQYRLPIATNTDFSDPDGDGMNNWQEWRCDTVPTNDLSVLKMSAPTNDLSGIVVQWASVNTRTYFLERSTDLGAQPPFLTLATNIAGQVGTTTYTDTNAVGTGPFFYRVGVQE